MGPTATPVDAAGNVIFGAGGNHLGSTITLVDSYGNPISLSALLPPGWNTAWLAAKSAAKSQAVNVAIIGDSVSVGWQASDINLTSYAALVRAYLLSLLPQGGDYYSIVNSAAITANFGGPGSASYPIVINGTYNTDWAAFAGGYTFIAYPFAGAGLTPLMTFTSPYACTQIDIIYQDFNAGTWHYQVDGGAAIAVTDTGPNSNAGAILKRVSISGLSNAVHTIAINTPGTQSVGNILGFVAYKQSTGLFFANHSWEGMGLVQGNAVKNSLTETTNAPPDRLDIFQGYQGTTAAPTNVVNFGFPTQPSLAIIALGINDATQSVTGENFLQSLGQLVQSLRRGQSNNCSIIILALWCPTGSLASATRVTNMDFTAATYSAYFDIAQAMTTIASQYNCALIDAFTAFGQTPVTAGLITSATNFHPTTTGHSLIASLVEKIL